MEETCKWKKKRKKTKLRGGRLSNGSSGGEIGLGGLCRLMLVCVFLWGEGAWAQSNPSGPGPVNVAKGLSESSYSESSSYRSYRPPSNGANGDTNGDYTDNNCIHTTTYYYVQHYRYKDRNPWWQVDLGSSHSVFHFKIWGRSKQLFRLYPFTITVDGQTCVTVQKNPGRRDITVNCTKPLHGRVVRLTRQFTGHWDYVLNMCEFQILVCNAGYYGVNCDLPCDSRCSSEGCYLNDGKCISCGGAFWGDRCRHTCGHCQTDSCTIDTGECSGCKPGWYGDQCLTRCPSDRCVDKECNQTTGVCLDCPGNTAGDDCTECDTGFFGDWCQQACSSQTAGCQVCRQDGECTACHDNFKPPECTVCKEGFFKSNSTGRCERCSNNCGSKSCDPQTGKCNGCPDRRWGNRCGKNCPQGCVECDQDSGQCTKCDQHHAPPDCDECLDGYYQRTRVGCSLCTWVCLNGTFCDKTMGYCPVCPPGKEGRQCYNDCARGTYGQNCSQQCGMCQRNTCDPKEGTCDRCRPGRQLPLCQTECSDGTYGVDCQKSCGQCQGGVPCNKVTGACPACYPGWYPPTCQQECRDGRYGVNCTKRCGVCLNNAVCDKANGHCPCPIGKQPPYCDKDCQNGTYGQDCQHQCGQCKEGSACDPVSGHCPQGCQPGWIDPAGLALHLCQTECPAGLYGDQCNLTCGHCHSSSGPCHPVTGHCLKGCAEGFAGAQCMQESLPVSGDSPPQYLYIVVGVLVAVVAAFGIVITIVVYRLRRAHQTLRVKDGTGDTSPGEGLPENSQDPRSLEEQAYQNAGIGLESAQSAAANVAVAFAPPMPSGKGRSVPRSESSTVPGHKEGDPEYQETRLDRECPRENRLRAAHMPGDLQKTLDPENARLKSAAIARDPNTPRDPCHPILQRGKPGNDRLNTAVQQGSSAHDHEAYMNLNREASSVLPPPMQDPLRPPGPESATEGAAQASFPSELATTDGLYEEIPEHTTDNYSKPMGLLDSGEVPHLYDKVQCSSDSVYFNCEGT